MNPLSPTTALKPAPSTFSRGIILLLTVFLAAGTISAQDTKKPHEDELKRLVTEGTQLRLVLRTLNVRLGEAYMLTLIAAAYSQLEQNQKAIEKFNEALPLFRAEVDKQGN